MKLAQNRLVNGILNESVTIFIKSDTKVAS